MKPGQWVRVKVDRPEDLNVRIGDIGLIVEHPVNHPHGLKNKNAGYLAIQFKYKHSINGAYSSTVGVIFPASVEPIWTDEQLFEDDLR